MAEEGPEIGGTGAAVIADWDRRVRRRVGITVGLGLLAIIAFFVDLGTGPSGLGLREGISGLLDPGSIGRSASVILYQVRLPAATMALLTGVALALAGAEMQTILHNPLASPFTLGVSSAASFGASLAIVAGIGLPGLSREWLVAGNAFVFAFASVVLLQSVVRLRAAGGETLVLFGIALVFTFNALVALVQFVASADSLQQMVFWSMGSLARANWPRIGVLALVVVGIAPFSFAASAQLTALRLGEDRAASLGIDIRRLRFLALARVSLLAAGTVAFVGTIGFVGLVGPHIARMMVGEDHRFFLPASALAGAVMMALASILAKTLVPGVLLPIGIVTSFVGLPWFIGLIFARGGRP